MGRKTFNVDTFKDQINKVLAASVVSADRREGMIVALEYVLHETGNYRGYRYLLSSEVPEGHQPGIRIPGIRYDVNSEVHSFDDCDSTRRSYR